MLDGITLGALGRRFKSCLLPQSMVGVAQSGSARVKVLPSNFIVSCCGLTKYVTNARGTTYTFDISLRRFESCHILQKICSEVVKRKRNVSRLLVVTFKSLSNAQRGYVMNALWEYI